MVVKLLRYRSVSVNGLVGDGVNLYDDELTFKSFGPSLVDRSHFVPTVDLTANTGNLTASDRVYYDFPDGKDTGLKVPRIIRGKDIAEVIVDARNSKLDVDQAIADAKAEKEYDEKIKSLVNSSSDGAKTEGQ